MVTKDDVVALARARSSRTAARRRQRRRSPAGRQRHPAAPPMPTDLPDFARWGPVERLPFRSIRRATAAQMTASWTQIPHVHCQDDVDITRLEAFRQKHKTEIAAGGGRLTMTVFAMKAVTTALKTYPRFNASLDLAAQEIIVKNYFHIGIAVDSENGLVVPVIRDVDRKSIKDLAIEVDGDDRQGPGRQAEPRGAAGRHLYHHQRRRPRRSATSRRSSTIRRWPSSASARAGCSRRCSPTSAAGTRSSPG